MDYEKVFLKTYHEMKSFHSALEDEQLKRETTSNDDYYEDGFIAGMDKVLNVMHRNLECQLNLELLKLQEDTR